MDRVVSLLAYSSFSSHDGPMTELSHRFLNYFFTCFSVESTSEGETAWQIDTPSLMLNDFSHSKQIIGPSVEEQRDQLTPQGRGGMTATRADGAAEERRREKKEFILLVFGCREGGQRGDLSPGRRAPAVTPVFPPASPSRPPAQCGPFMRACLSYRDAPEGRTSYSLPFFYGAWGAGGESERPSNGSV